MTMRWIISNSRPTLFVMGHVLFNCNRVFSGFEFIFLNPKRVRGEFRYYYSGHASIIF